MNRGACIAPRVLIVAGAMDRGSSFAPVALHVRHLDLRWPDRPGYGKRIDDPPATTFAEAVAAITATLDGEPTVVVGHSVGAVIALAAATARPDLIGGVGAFEPPTPWHAGWPDGGPEVARPPDSAVDPAQLSEWFAVSSIGSTRWNALPARARAQRRREGAALVADLEMISAEPPGWGAVPVPLVLGTGTLSPPHFRVAVRRIASDLQAPVVELATGHLAHVDDPRAFATFVGATVDHASGAQRSQ